MSNALLDVVHDGQPPAWPRPRFDGGHVFNQTAYTEYLHGLQWAMKSAAVRARRRGIDVKTPYEGRVKVVAAFFRSNRTKIDLDNLVKVALDAMTGIWIVDDSQVIEIHTWKDLGNPRPRVELQLWRV